MLRHVIAAALLLSLSLPLPAAERFPHPQFDSGYTLPVTTVPAARSDALACLDVAVLIAALAAATYLALRQRSRRTLYLLTLFSLAYFGFWRKGCVCPVGATQNVVLALSDPTYAAPLTVLAFFLLPLLFTLFFGRTFCAAVCPLGAAQEVVALWPLRLPAWLNRALGMLPVVYLGIVVLLAATGAGFFICRMDPFVSFFRLSGSARLLAAGAALLAVGIFVARPYCRFLCPYGVLLNWASRLSRWHATITPDECIQCRLCENACPFGAILKPTEPASEPRPAGRRRLALLLLLLPVLALVGVGLGSRLDVPLSRLHPTVRLAEQVHAEDAAETDAATLESETFRAAGTPTPALYAEALALRKRFRIGGALLGGFVALAFGSALIGLSVRRTRTDYEPDRGLCVSCGRCFAYCPKEHERRKR